jgi:hypothetical protein
MAKVSARMRAGAWIAAGLLGGGFLAGAVVSQLGSATAASPAPSPRAYGGPGAPMPGGGPMPGFGGRLRGLPPLGGPEMGFGGKVLHSEATVEAPDGTTKVVVSQTGDITDVTESTITVKSTDGFDATYTVDKNTRISLNGTDGTASSLKTGDTVHVFGTKSGSTNHANAVMDGMPTGFMMFRHDQRTPPKPQASPNTSSSSTT